jgi:hypothetical protein
MRYSWLILLALSVTNCGSGNEAAESTDDPQGPESNLRLPALIRVSTPRIASELLLPLANIAVTSTGSVFALATINESPMLALFDSTGALLRRFGVLGEGPGEMLRAGSLTALGDTLVVVAPNRPVVIYFDLDGRLIRERRLKTSNSAGLRAAESTVELAIFHGAMGSVSQIISENLETGQITSIIDLTDPFIAAAAGAAGQGSALWPPAYVRDGERVLVGNGATYRIKAMPPYAGEPDVFGRDLPPRKRGPIEFAERKAIWERAASVPGPGKASALARLDTLEREVVPHFDANALHLDGQGRTWVFGGHQDSTFADVFIGPEFIGRHILPCLLPARGIAVNGVWVALRCHSYAEEGALELQVYRIE